MEEGMLTADEIAQGKAEIDAMTPAERAMLFLTARKGFKVFQHRELCDYFMKQEMRLE